MFTVYIVVIIKSRPRSFVPVLAHVYLVHTAVAGTTITRRGRGARPWRCTGWWSSPSPSTARRSTSRSYATRSSVSTRILGRRTAPFHLSLYLTVSRMVLPQDPSTDLNCALLGRQAAVGRAGVGRQAARGEPGAGGGGGGERGVVSDHFYDEFRTIHS